MCGQGNNFQTYLVCVCFGVSYWLLFKAVGVPCVGSKTASSVSFQTNQCFKEKCDAKVDLFYGHPRQRFGDFLCVLDSVYSKNCQLCCTLLCSPICKQAVFWLRKIFVGVFVFLNSGNLSFFKEIYCNLFKR